jgi:hypothetical protein
MSKPRFFLLLLLLAAIAWAQRSMTVAEVIAFVKSQIQMKGDDRTTADFILHKIRLSEKLDDRTVEDLQGQGAGAKTVQALRKLSQESAGLPAPPPPPAAAPGSPPIPPPDSIEQAEALHAIKEYALNYTRNLPNFVCVQYSSRVM